MAYLDKVREFVVENFLFGDDGGLTEDTSLMEKGIVDSTGVMELVTFLEETFGITVENEELIPENLDSLNNIKSFLEKKVGSAPELEEDKSN
ncbi:acyl carrier protein [Planctomycetota bacterium]